MNVIRIIISFLFIFEPIICKMDRSAEVYKSVIVNVYDYFKCNRIILCTGPVSEDELNNFQYYFSTLNIQTSIVNRKIINSVSENNYNDDVHTKKSLIVFFDNSNDIKLQILNSAGNTENSIFLIFCNNHTNIDEFFANIHPATQRKIIISQQDSANIYNEIISKVAEHNIIAKWCTKNGFHYLTLDERQTDIRGQTLRAAVRANPPVLRAIKSNNTIVKLSGYLGNIMDILQEELNFNMSYQEVADPGLFENGAWTGGVGLLVNKSIDILLTTLVISSDRVNVIDYTTPILETNYRVFIKQSKKTSYLSTYFKPFQIELWYVIIVILALTSTIILLIGHLKKNKSSLNKFKKKANLLNLIKSLFDVHSVLCGQSLESSSHSPLRIVHLTIHTTAFIVLSSYSAILLSLLTVNNYNPPFKTFEDFLKDGSYKMGSVKNAGYLAMKTGNEAMQKIFYKHLEKQNPAPASLPDGLRRMCCENKYAFISLDIIGSSFKYKNCTVVPLEIITEVNIAIGLRKNSPFRKIINDKLTLLKENGVLEKLAKNYLPQPKIIEEPWTPIEIADSSSIIFLLLCTMAVTIFLLWAEIYTYRKFSRRKKKSIQRNKIQRRKHY